jgi:membrane associated rhomboid family serine protease
MFIPIRTDYRMAHMPWVNYALIAANIAIFVMGYNGDNDKAIRGLLLDPDEPQLHQFFTSVFLHAGWTHLIGNMVFLWVFGNAVNDRLGHAGYLAFYLAGGVLACLGYILVSGEAPLLGASGAISAVTGAYLVLLPRARVTLLVILYIITTIELSSIYFLLFQLAFNLVMSLTPELYGQYGGGVAYVAHCAGYAFGILMAFLLLVLRVLPRDVFDLLSLFRASHRRQRYRQMVAQGYEPFVHKRADQPFAPPEPIVLSTTDAVPTRETQLRRDISEAYSHNDLDKAIGKYLELIQVADDAVLPRQQQLDVANRLMSENRHPAAADAYERFLRHYGDYEHLADISLMLGLLYGRYLQQYDLAERHLLRAAETLRDPQKLALAQTDLQTVRRRLGRQ